MISTQWGKALEPNIKKYIQDGYNEHPDFTPEIFRVEDDSTGIQRYHDSFGPALIPASSEGAESQEVSISNGYETVTRPKIFKAKMPITEELNRWNLYKGAILDRSTALGSAGIQTINRYAIRPFTQGFSTTTTEYGDAKPLFSTLHPRIDGGATISNASSTGDTLTEANLETAVINLRQQKSGTGKTLGIGFNENLVLQVPNNLEKEAVIITGSTKRSGTPNNDLNWYLGKYSVFVNPFIGSDVTDAEGNTGSDTAWFLLARGVHKLQVTWDMHPTFKLWDEESKNTLQTQIYMSLKAFWWDFRGTWASKGNGLAYSS